MRRAGIVLPGDGLTLGLAHGAQGVGQDLAQQFVLGVEVPVEDALAHAEAVDDAGHRRGVVPVGGEGRAAKSISRGGAGRLLGVSRRDMVP